LPLPVPLGSVPGLRGGRCPGGWWVRPRAGGRVGWKGVWRVQGDAVDRS